MWARKRLDLGWRDIVSGTGALLRPAGAGCRARLAAAVEAACVVPGAPEGNLAIACLSVRSGFDLLWQALALPAGSEVIFSALTIHDMPRIAATHGLVPVPADLDLNTLAPTRATLEAALTPQTRALVVAHLCGARQDLTPCVEFARRHKLVLIEDCAQAYAGPEFWGDSRADVSMFSFGTIKTATALGGGVLVVRQREWLDVMRRLQAAYPVASRRWFAGRLAKNSLIKMLSLRPWYGLFVSLCRWIGQDYDRVINGAVRGFPGPAFFARIRQQPPAALLALLLRRLTGFNAARLERRAELGRGLVKRLEGRAVCPGTAGGSGKEAVHSHWVFPVLTIDPARLIAGLRAAGFDATQGQSLCAVAAPAGREALAPRNAQRFLREVVFLPVYAELTDRAADRLAGEFSGKEPGNRRKAGQRPAAPGKLTVRHAGDFLE